MTGDDTAGYSRLAVWGNAAVALAVTAVVLWAVSGFDVGFEILARVSPTVEGGGVGAGWVAGNSVGWLEALVALVHFADVVMGVFILAMVFVHWGAFRRLAARMRRSGAGAESGRAAADGGETPGEGGGAE